jgi:hypothetical protein
MVPNHRAAITLSLLALGYIGAAISYTYLLGSEIDFPYLCPACPNIDSVGAPLSKFIWRTISMGTLNAVLFVCIFWMIIALAAGFKRLLSN